MKGIFFPRLNSKEGYKELIEGVEKPPRRLLTQTVLKKKKTEFNYYFPFIC